MTTGKNEEDRSRTDPIEWSMYFKGFVTVLQCASEIVGQLLLELFNNEQPLRYLPKCILLHQFDTMAIILIIN